MDVELRYSRRLSKRAVALPQIVAPFREHAAFLLVLHEMPSLAFGWKQPNLGLVGVEGPPPPDGPDNAPNHRSGQRNIECLLLASLGSWDIHQPSPPIDMFDPNVFQRRGP